MALTTLVAAVEGAALAAFAGHPVRMLALAGLTGHARQRPGELSGRPTGSGTGKQIMRLLRAVVRSEGVTALVSTHDPALIDIADSVLNLEDGRCSPALTGTG